MPYTVSLCRDDAGWFATMREPPPELARRALAVEDPRLAYRVLDVAYAVARRLDRRDDAERVAQAIARPPLFG